MREVTLTCRPTTPYFIRSGEPIFPNTTWPVWTPIPISTSGRSSCLFCSLIEAIANCIATAQATARCAGDEQAGKRRARSSAEAEGGVNMRIILATLALVALSGMAGAQNYYVVPQQEGIISQ